MRKRVTKPYAEIMADKFLRRAWLHLMQTEGLAVDNDEWDARMDARYLITRMRSLVAGISK